MNKNYSAWNINVGQVSELYAKEQLLTLVRFALLAPSTHNTQPWKFSISDSYIVISPDFSKKLPVGDPKNHFLYISLGTALENLLIAADYLGLKTKVSYPSTFKDPVKINITKGKTRKHSPNHLLNQIKNRHSNKFAYKKENIPTSLSGFIKAQSDQDVELHISNPETKSRLVDISVRATGEAMNNSSFRKELSSYLKTNNTKSSYGMPGFVIGLPTPASYVFRYALRYLNPAKVLMKKDERLLKEGTKTVCVIAVKKETSKSLVKVGQAFERIALEATREGIATHIVAASVQVGTYYKQVADVLGTHATPELFFRIGYPTKKAQPLPRFTAEEVISI